MADCFFQTHYLQKLELRDWLAFYAVMGAIIGWLFAAWVQVRNSVKQHTVNTMLGSRLSTAFQQRIADFRSKYPLLPTPSSIKDGDWNIPDNFLALEGARYLLNYYEFIAVGIREGDFDELLMEECWWGIVTTLHRLTNNLIEFSREKQPDGTYLDPTAYENFLWLSNRWKRPKRKQGIRAWLCRYCESP